MMEVGGLFLYFEAVRTDLTEMLRAGPIVCLRFFWSVEARAAPIKFADQNYI